MQIDIKVVPGAANNEIRGWLGDALKLRVRAAPEKGKANKAVIALLAETLDIAPARICIERGEICIERGQNRPLKRVSIDGIDAHVLAQRLGLAATP